MLPNNSHIRCISFEGRSLTSAVIRYVTRSKKWSHIACLKSDGTIVECWPTAKNRFSKWIYSSLENHTKGTPYTVWGLPATSAEVWKFDKECDKVIGTKYDWIGLVGFVIRFIPHCVPRLFCSEGATELVKMSTGRFAEWVPFRTSPQDFVEIFNAAGAIKLEEGIT